MNRFQRQLDEQRRRRELLGHIVSIIIATAICLMFVVIAADDARVAQSYAQYREHIVRNGYQP